MTDINNNITSETYQDKETVPKNIKNPDVSILGRNFTEEEKEKKEEKYKDNNSRTKNNNDNNIDLNKKFILLNNLSVLLKNINKKKLIFYINENFEISINLDKFNSNYTSYKLKNINNLVINSSITLSNIYMDIMEYFYKTSDFNINIIFNRYEYNDVDDIIPDFNLNLFGCIPIYDEKEKKINFYEDYQSINNYIKSLNKVFDDSVIDIYTKLEKFCELKKKTHAMTTKHYFTLNRYFLIPSIILSSGSGIVSFLASSKYFEEQHTYLTLGVGIASSFTTLFQSFSSAFEFSTKAEAHQNATESYDQLLTQIKFEKMNPTKKPEIFIDLIEKQILDTKQRCKYTVPESIESQYNDNKFNNYKEDIQRDLYKKFIKLKSDLYYQKIKDTNNHKEIDFDKIQDELQFDEIYDHDDCCKKKSKCGCPLCCV